MLPVNLPAIINGGDTTTNYQMMPGDRLVVYRDPIVRTTVFLDRLAAPFNSVLNSMLQYSLHREVGQGDQRADQRRDRFDHHDDGNRGDQRRANAQDQQQPGQRRPLISVQV